MSPGPPQPPAHEGGGFGAVLRASGFRRLLIGQAVSSLGDWDATVPSLVPQGTLEEANGLVLASSYGCIPIAAALFGGLRLAAQHIPSAIPFGTLFSHHPTSFAFFFDSATFVFSASMIARLTL